MKIPMGNFGQSVAVAPTVPGLRSGPGPLVGEGLVATGHAISLEARRMEAEDEARRKEAERVAAITAQAKAKNGLADLFDEMQTGLNDGSIAKTDVQKLHAERSQKLIEESVNGVSPDHQELVRASLMDDMGTASRNMRKVVAQKDRADIQAGILSYMEDMQRFAGRGEDQRQEAMKNVEAFLQSAGPQAGMDAAGISKQAQAFKEGVTANYLDRAISQEATSGKALAQIQKDIASDKFPELDPAKRTMLENKIMARQQHLELQAERAANRAERAQERLLKKAEAEFNVFQSMADKGTDLAPEYVDRVLKMTAGTPYHAGVAALMTQAKEAGGIAAQPVAVQQAMLDQLDTKIAKEGRSPALDKRREQIQKVLNGSESDLKANGIRAGLERGVIKDIAPLDMSSPQAFSASIAARLSQSEAVSQWAGKTVSPFDAGEADKIGEMLGSLQPKERSQMIAGIASAVGPRVAGAVADQLDKKDRALGLAFSMAGAQTTANRNTSELILKGATAIKDGAVMKDDKKVTGWKATIAKELEGVFPDAKLEAAAKDAAYYIAAGFAQEDGGTVSTSRLQNAVRLAIGGGFVEHQGKRLPVAAELGDSERERAANFEKRIRSIPADEIMRQAPDGKVRAGGAEVPAMAFAASVPGQELVYAGYGRYGVLVNGRPATNAAGRPIIVTVR